MNTKIMVLENDDGIIESPKSNEGNIVADSMILMSVEGKRFLIPMHKIDAEIFRACADSIDTVKSVTDEEKNCLMVLRPNKSEMGVLVT